jgi:hypothetical protein
MNMKKLKIVIILIAIIFTFINTNCSSHCDDEDYTRDQKEAVLHQKDSLKVQID